MNTPATVCRNLVMRMHFLNKAARMVFARVVICALALAIGCPSALTSQQAPAQATPAGNGSTNGPATGIRTVVNIEGQWRFHSGDDLAWADPAFNDSDWVAINLNQSLAEQGL